jgi:NADH:ubiquinone oxidoreductase subunit E
MMQQDKQEKTALRLGIAAAVLVLVCASVLIGDYLIALNRAPEEGSLVERLEQQVKTDFGIAEELHGERERQTLAEIAREQRSQIVGWVLVVAGAVFVASAKRYMSFHPQPLPTVDRLVDIRFAPPTPMGLKQPKAPASEEAAVENGIDLSFVDDLVKRFGGSREAAIPILQAIQNHYRYLPDEALHRVCELTEITPAQIAGTSSFYAQFRRSPVGRYVVRVCHGTACHVAGAEQITKELRRHLEIAPDEDTDADRRFTLDAVACLGCCSIAPVMMIEEETAGRLTPASARQALDALGSEA